MTYCPVKYAAYRAANIEQIRHREAMREFFRSSNRESTRSEASKQYKREWREANQEFCSKLVRDWKKKNSAARRAYEAHRRALERNAMPPWADRKKIVAIYRKAKVLSEMFGESMHVDHIIPLKHKLVCGLHVHNNLQILTAQENVRKKNKFVPFDC